MRFTSYAQNFEDVMLWRALRQVKDGFYIDIGAADPVEMSVTKAFHDAGWRGVNVEPTAHYVERLRAARPDDINLDVAVGRADGTLPFFEIVETGLSTLDREVAAGHRAAGWAVRERGVVSLTLAEICRRHAPAEIQFLKIDVEGAEAEVLAGADFKTYRPWIVLLEATRPLTNAPAAPWEAGLLAAGYRFVWFDGLNRFYIADEHAGLQKHFELPPNSFDEFDVFDFKTEEFRATRLAAERATRGRLNEIRLLDEEVRLRRRGQARAAAELDQARQAERQAAAELQAATRALAATGATLAARERQLAAARAAAVAEHRHWEVLNRLAYELRWESGPRALRMVLPLARMLRMVLGRGGAAPAVPVAAEAPLALPFEAVAAPPALPPPGAGPGAAKPARRAVHQFHPGSVYGDAVTNSMLLTRKILRALGYRSEIYVQYRDETLRDELLLLDDLPGHDDYVLIVLHSLGYDQTERIAALPAPKILMYHNITPAEFLRGIPALAALADVGRAQLDFWRPRVAATLAVSPFNALELRRHGYDDVAVCPLLFDIDELRAQARPGHGRLADDPFTILFVGRVVESKGQVDLVDAFDLFRRQYPDPCLLVLVGRYESGGDAYAEAVFERIGGHGMRQIVEVTGQVTDEEVASWYDRADLYVSVSQHEGFGVPLIEAMAHDVPVIAYGAGGVPDTMGGARPDPRTVRASRAPAEMAAAMLAVARDPALRAEILAAQRHNLKRFALPRHLPVLVQALARAGARPPEAGAGGAAGGAINFTVTGHVNGTYSLAAVNRAVAIALDRAAPGRVRVRPVETTPTAFLGGVPAADAAAMARLVAASPAAGGRHVVISQHYPVFVPETADDPPADLLAALFFWEESVVPAAMIDILNGAFGAVFAPSGFVAKVLQDSGLSIPVRVVGYAPPLKRFAALAEARLAEDRPPPAPAPFTFLHVSSGFPRKGVDVLLAAFAAAFAGTAAAVRLVIKTFPNPHNETAAQIARLRAAHPALPEIALIDRDLGEDELLALYRTADAMVLPTRGEGFNLPAAEAMAAGLPLIVTAAGGHADFITAAEAVLIPARVAPSGSHFADGLSLWFEPDLAALAAALRAVVANPGQAVARAAAARRTVAARLEAGAWAARLTAAAALCLGAPRSGAWRYGFVSSWGVRCGVAEYTRQLVEVFAQLTPPAQISIFCDDRGAGRADAAPKVVPSWACGGDDVERLAAAISREDPDVLVVEHQPGLLGWGGLAALLTDARVRWRPMVVTLHAALHLAALPAVERAAVTRALRGAARVVVHRVADVHFLAEAGVDANVTMIPQGAPAAAPLPALRQVNAGESPVIGSFGFLLPSKGLPGLIAALPLLREVYPGARLRLVNALHDAPESAAERLACQALADQLGVAEAVEWHTDFLPTEAAAALLRNCDLIVLPYLRTGESSSAALRSCLASGVPVAVTPEAIFDEAADAVWRLAGAAPAEIARGVAALLGDLAARRATQAAAARWALRRGWDKVGRQLHGLVTGLAVNAALDRQASHQPGAARRQDAAE